MILDRFYILFKTNAEEIIRGNKAVEKSTKDTEQALKKTNDQTKEIGQNFVKMVEAVGGALGSVAGFQILKSGVQGAIDYNTQLKLVGENAGITAEKLRTAGIAARKFGGTDQMGMQDAIAMAKTLRQSGINERDPAKMMRSVRNLMSTLDVNLQQQTLEKVYGLSEAGIRQATSGAAGGVTDEEFNRKWSQAAQQAAGTNAAAEAAYATNAAEVGFDEQTKSFFNDLLSQVSPTLNSIFGLLQRAVGSVGGIPGAAGIMTLETAKNVGLVAAAWKYLRSGTAVKAVAPGVSAGLRAGAALGGAGFAEAGVAAAGGLGLAAAGGVYALGIGTAAATGYGLYKGFEIYNRAMNKIWDSMRGPKKREPLAQSIKAARLPDMPRLPVNVDKYVLNDVGEFVDDKDAMTNAASIIDRARGVQGSVKKARRVLSSAAAVSPSTVNSSVRIDKIEVVTQSTDVQGIASGIAGALTDKVYTALGFLASTSDNGQVR